MNIELENEKSQIRKEFEIEKIIEATFRNINFINIQYFHTYENEGSFRKYKESIKNELNILTKTIEEIK